MKYLKTAEKIITPLIALEKMRNWCAYQERSQFDVRKKLFEYRLEPVQVESIIADLINEKFLDEERFALAYAGGKFRIKNWGKNKIKMGLKQHRVSEPCIRKALAAIDPDQYLKILEKVIEKKIKLTKSNDERKKYYAIFNYAVSRGFESDLVTDLLNLTLKK